MVVVLAITVVDVATIAALSSSCFSSAVVATMVSAANSKMR